MTLCAAKVTLLSRKVTLSPWTVSSVSSAYVTLPGKLRFFAGLGEPAGQRRVGSGMSRIITLLALAPIAIITSLGACSGQRSDSQPAQEMPGAGVLDEALSPTAAPAPSEASGPAAGGRVLSLEGLGTLRIGQPLPPSGSWAERGAQASDACRVISSPDYPKVYAITEGGKVRRITLSEGAKVTTIEGITPGSTRKQVDEAFPGLSEAPHKYVTGGIYLTTPQVQDGDLGLRFELTPQGRVTAVHFGTMPVLGYVEACS